MDKYTVVLDIGSQYITAGLDKDDFYIKIPAVVAVDESTKQIVSVGVSALNAINMQVTRVKPINPILEGAVIDTDGFKALLDELFLRVLPHKTKNFSEELLW